jgi:hypothetical protein
MRLKLFLFFLLTATALQAQMERVIHQIFEVGEAQKIQLDLVGTYNLQPWAGNNIMSETKIQLYDAPSHVLDFFIKEKGRYEILDSLTQDSILFLAANDKERSGIQYKGTSCYEVVEVRIFVPDSFEILDPTILRRKEEEID